jgi:dTDP-4-dehydrorhamnose reductase
MSKAFHIVILGADTPVGRALTDQAHKKEISLHAIGTTDWDLTDSDGVLEKLKERGPSFLINCILPSASGTTAEIAGVISKACNSLNIGLMQISSNNVFAGQAGESFSEDDDADPQTDEGKVTLAVENVIREMCAHSLILRIGWLFSSMGQDDVSKLLDLAKQEKHLQLSDRKILCPTSACDIASVLLAMVNQLRYAPLWDIYHYCSAEQTTLFKFAEVVVAEARQHEDLNVTEISPDPRHAMNTIFAKPTPKIASKKVLYTFGIRPKPWRQALSRIMKTRYAAEKAQ